MRAVWSHLRSNHWPRLPSQAVRRRRVALPVVYVQRARDLRQRAWPRGRQDPLLAMLRTLAFGQVGTAGDGRQRSLPVRAVRAHLRVVSRAWCARPRLRRYMPQTAPTAHPPPNPNDSDGCRATPGASQHVSVCATTNAPAGGTWRCNWCECRLEETSGKSPGPDGRGTLCSACGSRYRSGATAPPKKNNEGKYACEKCGRLFENIASLSGHKRFCDGGTWRCQWCTCKRDETSGKGPGPEGAQTLCSQCSARWRSGKSGPPETDANGRYTCLRCERTFESYRALGVHGRDCDGGIWRCSWCDCRAEDTTGKTPGPDGPGTLCGTCGSRYRSGASGPAVTVRPPALNAHTKLRALHRPSLTLRDLSVWQDAFGQYPCEQCGRTFESISGLGVHRRRCGMLK